MKSLRGGDDTGAVAVVTALVVATLLLPLLWFVVDIGGMFTERRQLQNAADAGALAAAQECSKQADTINCTASLLFGPAESLVDANDGFDAQATRNQGVTFDNSAWYLCGNVVPAQECERDPIDPSLLKTHGKYDCPAIEPTVDYVQVRVVSGGVGWKGYISETNTQVFACARARIDAPQVIPTWYPGSPASSYMITIPPAPPSPSSWVETFPPIIETNPGVGSPGRANTLAFTMPKCIWEVKTANGTVYGTPQQNITYYVDKVDTLVNSAPYRSACGSTTVNSSANGALLGAKNICDPLAVPPRTTNCGGTATGVTIGQTFEQDQGNWSSFHGLQDLLNRNPNQTWIVPVYSTSYGTGNGLYYNIVAFVGFHITSYDFNPKGNAEPYISGYFTTTLCTVQSECGGSSEENTGVGNSTFTTHPGPAPSTHTTTYPGVPGSSMEVVVPPVPGYSSSVSVPGDPAAAKPVL